MMNFRLVRVARAALAFGWLLAACAPTPAPTPALTATALPPTSSPTAAPVATIRPPTPAPSPAATGLTLLATDTVIRLTWPAQPGARGYFVFRDGASQPLHTDALTTLTYEDIGLSNGRVYSYSVAIADAQGKPGSIFASGNAAPGRK
jgi:hypothetical protein